MTEEPSGADFPHYVCSICGRPTEDDPRYVLIRLDWPYSGESQGLGAHTACLRAVVSDGIPLANE